MGDSQADGAGQLVDSVGSTLQAVGELFIPTPRKPGEQKQGTRASLPSGPELPVLRSSAADCQECFAKGSVSYGRCQVCGDSDSVGGPLSTSPCASTASKSSQPVQQQPVVAKGLPIAEMFWKPNGVLGAEDEPSPCARAPTISPVGAQVKRPNAQRTLFTDASPACPADDEDVSAPSTPHKSEPEERKHQRSDAIGTLPVESFDKTGCKSDLPPSVAVCAGDADVVIGLAIRNKPVRATRSAPPPSVQAEATNLTTEGMGALGTVSLSTASPTDRTKSATLRNCPLKTACAAPAQVSGRPHRSAPSTSLKSSSKPGLSALMCALLLCIVFGIFRKEMGQSLHVGLERARGWHVLHHFADSSPASSISSILNVTAKYSHGAVGDLKASEAEIQQHWLPSLSMVAAHHHNSGGSSETESSGNSRLSMQSGALKGQNVSSHGRAAATSVGALEQMSFPSTHLPSLGMLLPSTLRGESSGTTMQSNTPVKLSLDTSLRNSSGGLPGTRRPALRQSIARAPRQSVNWLHRRLVLGFYCKWYRYVATMMQGMGLATKKVGDSSIPIIRAIGLPKMVTTIADRMADTVIMSANSTLELLDCSPRDLLPSAS